MSKLTNEQVAEKFAARNFVGCNSNGTLIAAGDVIYSYGEHWPIAFADRSGAMAYINGDKYGTTTSKQTSRVAAELSHAGFGIVYVSGKELKEKMIVRG